MPYSSFRFFSSFINVRTVVYMYIDNAHIIIIPVNLLYELEHDNIHKMICASIKDSDQTGHPASLIIFFVVRFMRSVGFKPSLGGQRRL